LPTEPVAISFDESISRGADQIGHLEWWPGHLLFLRRPAFERQRIQRTRRRMQVTLGEMQIAGRLFQIVMTQQDLNVPQVRALLEQMGRETVTKRVRMT